MKTLTTKAVILGHKNIGENDKLIFLYSEDLGKLKVMAKGAHRLTSKFTGHLETLNLVVCSLYFGPKNIILTEIKSANDKIKLNENLDTVHSALKIAEITDRLLWENHKVENLIPLLQEFITHLNSSQKHFLCIAAYIIKFLATAGVLPDFTEIDFPIPLKYLKFLKFIKEKSFNSIGKITLTKKETENITELIKKLISLEDGNYTRDPFQLI